VALGNAKSHEALPALIRALDDEEALVRGHVAWALGQIGSPKGISALQKRLRIESDPRVKMEIEDAITEAEKPHSTETNTTALHTQ
jgi:epoxyqueuosine reductase